MADDREFDRMMEEELSALPPPDSLVREVTPWRRAMRRIVWGIGLTTLTLNFWYLDYLLPAIGVVLLFLGFRTLRRENRWFFICWLVSLCDLAACFLERVLDATIWADVLLPLPLWSGMTALGLVQTFCLWKGIRAVRRAAGQEDRAKAAAALLAFQSLLVALGVLGGGTLQLHGLFFLAVFLTIYLCVMRSLSRLPALLDGAGYGVRAAPARLPERGVWIAWFALLAAGILLAGALWCRYPMEWAPVPDNEQAGLEEIRSHLVELGVPEQVADDLSAEDLFSLEGALRVEAEVTEAPFNNGKMMYTSTGVYYSEYVVKELKVTNLAVELPGRQWKIIHHFQWQVQPKYRTTECIALKSAAHTGVESVHMEGTVTGRLLYDKDGTTYLGDYYRLEEEVFTTNSIFWSPTEKHLFMALFSIPLGGENCRGYLTYPMSTGEDNKILQSWMNYTHQVGFWNYPLMTAEEYEKLGIWRSGSFQTAQASINWISEETEEDPA